jgi:hypothetical protein
MDGDRADLSADRDGGLIVRLFASLSAVLLLGFAVPTWAGSSAPPGVPLSAVGSANGVPALDTNKNLIVPGYQINVANAFAAQNAYHTNAPTTQSDQLTNSLFIGLNSGAAFPYATPDGYGSVGVGEGALQSLSAIGQEIVCVGVWACQSLTTGAGNTALGVACE